MDDRYCQDKAAGIIHPIDHLTLDEKEISILTNAVKKIQNKRRQEFNKSLKHASKIVASWPKWKRDLADKIFR
jgi:hypothetical protein